MLLIDDATEELSEDKELLKEELKLLSDDVKEELNTDKELLKEELKLFVVPLKEELSAVILSCKLESVVWTDWLNTVTVCVVNLLYPINTILLLIINYRWQIIFSK
jgi:hypothetical protein